MNFAQKYIFIVLHAKCDILYLRFICRSNFGKCHINKDFVIYQWNYYAWQVSHCFSGCAGCFKSASHKKSLSLWNTAIWEIMEWWLGGRDASVRNYTTISLHLQPSSKPDLSLSRSISPSLSHSLSLLLSFSLSLSLYYSLSFSLNCACLKQESLQL